MGKRNVYSDVKKNYKAAAEFMHEVTKSYLCEAFMEWAGLESLESCTPANITVPTLHASRKKKVQFLNDTIGTFVDEYILPEFDVEKVWRVQQEQKAQQRNQQAGKNHKDTLDRVFLMHSMFKYHKMLIISTPGYKPG